MFEAKDDEPIDREWVSTWTIKEKHVWTVLGSSLFLYENRSGPLKGLWTILSDTDGDEHTHCHVHTRGEMKQMVRLIDRQLTIPEVIAKATVRSEQDSLEPPSRDRRSL